MFCDKKKLIFVHIPKNAGTSLSSVLSGPNQFLIDKPWSSYKEYYKTKWDEYTTFSVVRNPLDRFISLFKYIRMNNWFRHPILLNYCKNETSINEFVRIIENTDNFLDIPILLPQSYFICRENTVMVDKLIRYKNIDKELEKINLYNIPKLNESIIQNHRLVELESNSISTLKQMYEKDFNIFDY
jgi:hypothetical protein